jgi:CubicO group peptidase (beta-lactamase class C family)
MRAVARGLGGAISLALILGAGAYAQPAPPAAAPVAADTPETTPSGAVFTLPQSWSLTTLTSGIMVLRPPEPDAVIALVAVRGAKDAPAAVAQAWAAFDPAEHRAVNLVMPQPPREGWDEIRIVTYETSPNERLAVLAIALRSGDRWTVALGRASQATVEKRQAAFALISSSLRPAAYKRESFAGRAAHPLDAARIETLKTFVQTSMQQLGVPGVGLALIDHGQVVYEGGLGVRELGKPDPVDAHTLFMIASNTKGMSTLLLSELVDQGKLSWDEPVVQAYPAFRLGSAETTAKVRIRDLVCACTGLPRKDFDWIFNTPRSTPASTTFDQLAATQPTSAFGEVFQYNNLMASAAGYIGGRVVHPDLEFGAAYDAAMQTMIFDPLGMRDTTLNFARALKTDHASPHGEDVDGRPSVADMDFNYAVIPYRPAGGAWSSAHDVSLYVLDELNRGRLADGRQLVSAKNLLMRRARSVPTGEDSYYGMGLEIDANYGVTVIHHGGSLAGFKSDWVALPDAGIGAVVLTNADNGGMLLGPFMRRLLEVVYDGKPQAAEDVASVAARHLDALKKERERLQVPAAPDAARALAASYVSPELGRIKVERDGAGVVFDFGAWKSHVASRKNDDGTTSFVTYDPTAFGIPFVVTQRADNRALVVRDGQHEYVYQEGG